MKYKLYFNNSFDSTDEYILREWSLSYNHREQRLNERHILLDEEQATILKLMFPEVILNEEV